MALIRRVGEALALEDVAEVAAAVGTGDLDSFHEHAGVLEAFDGAGDAVEVGGPAAAAAELVRCLVQGGVTPGACVHTLRRVVLVKLAGPGRLGALLAEDAELLWCECEMRIVQGRICSTCLEFLPLFNTARHSSSDFWTGYDILLESLALELKKPPIRGIGIDLREVVR